MNPGMNGPYIMSMMMEDETAIAGDHRLLSDAKRNETRMLFIELALVLGGGKTGGGGGLGKRERERENERNSRRWTLKMRKIRNVNLYVVR